jgi:poly(A) polymerase
VTRARVRHTPEARRAAEAVEAVARNLGARAFLVGGYVRDRLLDMPCKDLDVVVEGGLGTAVASALAQDPRARNLVVFPRFGTAQVEFEDLVIELVSARAESYPIDSRKPDVRPASLEEDMRRRDFTVNALIADAAGEVGDLTAMGLGDLEARLLRTPLPAAETFAEDPLRAVRAVRFAVALEFELHEDIRPAITACLDRLESVVSVERVNQEVRRMILGPRPGRAVQMLLDTGIGQRILPEVAAMSGIEQSGFHHLDVLAHTLTAVDSVAARPGPQLKPPLELRLRLGVLFHDAGKPATAQRDGDRVSFHGHPDLGAELAAAALHRLRFSGDEIEDVARLVSLHMRPIQYEPGWSEGAVRRLVRDSGDLLPAMLALAEADMAASLYPPVDASAKMGDLRRRVAGVDASVSHGARPPLDGHQLMERFNRPPGPWLKAIQEALVEAILDGALPAADVAAAWDYLDRHPELLAT